MFCSISLTAQYKHILPESDYVHWPDYKHLEFEDLSEIEKQKWNPTNHTIEGWDFSLPDGLAPAPNSLLGISRKINFNGFFDKYKLNFRANVTAVIWARWRDLEPKEGEYQIERLLSYIKEAKQNNYKVVLRILSTSKTRGPDLNNPNRGDAPLWLENYGIPIMPREEDRYNLNFDPAHPEFHKRYIKLIDKVFEGEIPELVDAAYIGYASRSYGDEGIGPHHNDPEKNDKLIHVRERIDAFGRAFENMEHKVFMGGPSHYGLSKGFGLRRGFVEMYLYTIPNVYIGQYVDDEGYLYVDETAPIIANVSFNGEENEEYEPAWVTKERGFRFGNTTNSFTYRYFISSLRALQMRCTYLLASGHLIPEMVPFIAQELGRTVIDAPDVWTFLYTAKISSQQYIKNEESSTVRRNFTVDELYNGMNVKNFERWLYQRDSEGFETEPALKINRAIKMWMVQPGNDFDYIARKGERVGFDIDDRWLKKNTNKKFAVKITYLDNTNGKMKLHYKFNSRDVFSSEKLTNDNKIKTATFIVNDIDSNALENNYDFIVSANKEASNITISMVRVVALN